MECIRLTKYSLYLKSLIEKYGALVCLFVWVIVQTLLLKYNGIKTDGEALNKIWEAKNLLNGESLSVAGSYFYLTEVIIIFIDLKLGFGFWFVVGFQLLLNLFALLIFYKFLATFTGSKFISIAGCLLLILCFPYQQYNTFLYTESIFFSLSIIYSCFLLQIKKLRIKELVFIVAFLCMLCVTRPSGIFFVAATIIYLFFFVDTISIWKKGITFIALLVISLLLLNSMMATGGSINILRPFSEQMIICEVPTTVLGTRNTSLQTDNSLRGLLNYIIDNPSDFLQLAYLKFIAFFGLSRAFYSTMHNGYLIVYFFSIYFLIIATLIRHFKTLPVAYAYLLSVVAIYALSVILSCDEWSNRFFLTLTPFLITSALYFFVRKERTPDSGILVI